MMTSIIEDQFTPVFKYYKQKLHPPSFQKVLDPYICNKFESFEIVPTNDLVDAGFDFSKNLRCFTISSVPGLYFIPNPFTNSAKRDWVLRCVEDYPKPQNKTNLKNPSKILWKKTCELIDEATSVITMKEQLQLLKTCPIWKLRWTTLGYHHNWDTKVYDERDKTDFPSELNQLSKEIAKILGWQHYNAQAAIVNYYHVGSTLSPHTDKSEKDLTFPLISISFGLSAIFLIGGESKETKPQAIFIRSGDVLIMTHQSRISYHAVPRILSCDEERVETSPTISDPLQIYTNHSRININIRQVS